MERANKSTMCQPNMVLFLLAAVIAVPAPVMARNTTECNGYQANFDIKSIVGAWHVVALIPENLFPENQKQVHCFKMELSETDEVCFNQLSKIEVLSSVEFYHVCEIPRLRTSSFVNGFVFFYFSFDNIFLSDSIHTHHSFRYDSGVKRYKRVNVSVAVSLFSVGDRDTIS